MLLFVEHDVSRKNKTRHEGGSDMGEKKSLKMRDRAAGMTCPPLGQYRRAAPLLECVPGYCIYAGIRYAQMGPSSPAKFDGFAVTAQPAPFALVQLDVRHAVVGPAQHRAAYKAYGSCNLPSILPLALTMANSVQ